jgi:hypothetical protein
MAAAYRRHDDGEQQGLHPKIIDSTGRRRWADAPYAPFVALALARAKARIGQIFRMNTATASVATGPLPFVAAVRHRGDRLPPATLLCVYRRRHVEHVTRLVVDARKAAFRIRLWALDGVAPELASDTVGTGAGSRFALLNKVAHEADPGWIVIADDDVAFVTPSAPRTLLAVAAAKNLDISQPAHARGSYRSHLITRQRILASARETTFVEIGPVVAFSPRARDLVLPFPDEGMGWGVELEWAALREQGLRLGILDCVALLHLAPPAGTYGVEQEVRDLKERVLRHGYSSFEEAQRTLVVHRLA